MIACISPGFSSANHTINTLRYSDRLKEKSKGNIKILSILSTVQENNFFDKNEDFLKALDVNYLLIIIPSWKTICRN